MRYAIYYTPPPGHPLTLAGSRWLGRDAFSGEVLAPPALDELDAADLASITAAPRRYGFHATLKAPFTLAEGQSEGALIDALEEFTYARAPATGPRLRVDRIENFLVLVPEAPSNALSELADDVVRAFDCFRAPLSNQELARRNNPQLNAAERKNLALWGYPYVFETFRFHMTLTGSLDCEQVAAVRPAISRQFGALLEQPIPLAWLALFVEPGPDQPFTIRSLHRLGERTMRATV